MKNYIVVSFEDKTNVKVVASYDTLHEATDYLVDHFRSHPGAETEDFRIYGPADNQ